jgi:hypothetical protein
VQEKNWPGILKKTVITLQALRFKLKCLNQTCISLKSILQLARTNCSDSATFIEKKRVEIGCGQKVNFRGQKNEIVMSCHSAAQEGMQRPNVGCSVRRAEFTLNVGSGFKSNKGVENEGEVE